MRTCAHKARSRPYGYFLKIDNRQLYQSKVIVWSFGKNPFRKYWYIFIEKQKSDQKPKQCEYMGG